MEDGELGVELGEIELPRYELSRDAPAIPLATYLARLESAETAAAASGLDALVVYADREHFANLAYLTGFEPRFEEALLVLVRGRPPRLVVGNECEAYAAVSPVELEVVRYQSFSLVSQPRAESAPLAVVLRDAGLDAKATARVGIAGWKYFEAAEFAEPETRLDTPAVHRRRGSPAGLYAGERLGTVQRARARPASRQRGRPACLLRVRRQPWVRGDAADDIRG